MEYTIKIEQDTDVVSPRTSCGQLGRMICFHKRYSLGDEHGYKSSDYSGWEEMEKALIAAEDAVVILPLYLYDHSGLTISTSSFSCPWDSGQIGFILATREAVLREYSRKHVTKKLRERVGEVLRGEVKEYDAYLTGDVWGYQILDEEGEVVDSCWGIYGYEYAEEEAAHALQYIKEQAA